MEEKREITFIESPIVVKGTVGLRKNEDIEDSYIFSHYVHEREISGQDLKDLRSLIDTVLGEESNASGDFEVFKEFLLEQYDKSQENNKVQELSDLVNKPGIADKEKFNEVYESNKEEECDCSIRNRKKGDHWSCRKHGLKIQLSEPSKKPSEGIGKFVIGCKECGNNIRI